MVYNTRRRHDFTGDAGAAVSTTSSRNDKTERDLTQALIAVVVLSVAYFGRH
jgi:hypothetical protein